MRCILCSLMALGILATTNLHAQTPFTPGKNARNTHPSITKKVQERISEIATTEAENFINEVQNIIESQPADAARSMINDIASIEVDKIVAKYADIIKTSYNLSNEGRKEVAVLLSNAINQNIQQTLELILAPGDVKATRDVSPNQKYELLIAAMASELRAEKDADGVIMTMLVLGLFSEGVKPSIQVFVQMIDDTANEISKKFVIRLTKMGFTLDEMLSLQREMKYALVDSMTKHCKKVLKEIMSKHGTEKVEKPLTDYLEKKYPGLLKNYTKKLKNQIEKKEKKRKKRFKLPQKKQKA